MIVMSRMVLYALTMIRKTHVQKTSKLMFFNVFSCELSNMSAACKMNSIFNYKISIAFYIRQVNIVFFSIHNVYTVIF